jgi:hypothetical protein
VSFAAHHGSVHLEGDLVKGLGPTLHFDGGADGRVMVADSLSYFEHEPWLNDVVVGASFAGAPTAAMCMRPGVKGWIAHEGGPGKDEAGISGLPLAQRFGMPAAAIATMSASVSEGLTLLKGTVSRCNAVAAALGVRPGQTGDEAARLMLKAPRGKPCAIGDVVDESIHDMLVTPQGRVYAVWSFSRVKGEHPHDVYCVASHGGKVMAQYALRVKPKGLIANDAGGGLNEAGSSGIHLVQELFGMAGATVSADSARIGDALSTYNDGVISAVNATAQKRGVRVGMPAAEAARRMLG